MARTWRRKNDLSRSFPSLCSFGAILCCACPGGRVCELEKPLTGFGNEQDPLAFPVRIIPVSNRVRFPVTQVDVAALIGRDLSRQRYRGPALFLSVLESADTTHMSRMSEH